MSGRRIASVNPEKAQIDPNYTSLLKFGNRSPSRFLKLITAYDAVTRLSLTPDEIDLRVGLHERYYLDKRM